MQEITFSTKSKIELVNITEKVRAVVRKAGVREGACLVFVPHATGAIIINENEPGLIQDTISTVERLFPKNLAYKHNEVDDNARSHLASAFVGRSETIPIRGGDLALGTWQSIFFLECDGPRAVRTVFVQVLEAGGLTRKV